MVPQIGSMVINHWLYLILCTYMPDIFANAVDAMWTAIGGSTDPFNSVEKKVRGCRLLAFVLASRRW